MNCRHIARACLLALLLSLGLAWPVSAEKDHSVTVTAEMRANARANVAKHPWAAARRDRAVRDAKPWLEMADADLWTLVTPQSLPRTAHTTLIRGTNRVAACPKCRDGIVPFGNYPWRIDATKRPWKLQCPNCGEIFPKNDFWAYYFSALDEHGKFRPGKGDARLLFNSEHPDPKDPLHKYGVDDGYGWHDETGLRWAFAAYYNSWGQWALVQGALNRLVPAYQLTSDARYAHKAGVLLDRIADVYPEMDTYDYIMRQKFEHSDGGSGYGRIMGCIWETAIATDLALAYDRVYDGLAADPTLVAFLKAQAGKFRLTDKSSFRAIQRNIEENLLLEIVKGVKDSRIHGNEGMHQVTMAAAAIALDRQPLTGELLDWIFQPGAMVRDKKTGGRRVEGGNLALVINNLMDRDGMGSEGAPGYSCWGLTMLPLAELLDRYPHNAGHNLFRDFPKYRQCFLTPLAWSCLGQATPPIGDSGVCGAWGTVGPSLNQSLPVMRAYRDPRIARRIWQLCDGHLDRLPGNVFDRDPDALKLQIARLAENDATGRPLEAVNLNGYGLAIVQTPAADPGRALWMYYGRNTGHGHRDRLNIGLYAQNLDMLPDLGYPEYASGRPKDLIWCRNSISHNVVIVDDQSQQPSYTGRLRLCDPGGKAQVIEAESPGIYAGATTYRRLTALVDVGPHDGYVVDFFRVRGGRTHRQSWHGPAAEAVATGLHLAPQAKGTFEGEATAVGQLPENWKFNPGYMYLYDVQRDRQPPPVFTLDYRAEDLRKRIAPGREPHVRLTCLTPCDEVALAHGDPPQNKSGNLRRLQYAVLSRKGEHLASLFVTLIEPYDARPLIRSARLLPLDGGPKDRLAAVVEVTLADGRTDTILCAESPSPLAAGGVTMNGTFGIVARRGQRVEFAKLVAGRSLTAPGVNLSSAGQITGRVVAVNVDKPDDNRLTLALDQAADASLVGRVAIFENDGVQDAAYTIRGVRQAGDAYEISTGDSTLIRGYANPKDLAAGYAHNVRPGDPVRVPLGAYLEPGPGR